MMHHGRMRRGFLKFILLHMLSERPRHGYDFMREFKERGGPFRPGPGSIYPTLSMLEDAGWVRSTESDGKRVYEITEEGLAHLREHGEDVSEAYQAGPGNDAGSEVRAAIRKLHAAVQQAAAGKEETAKRAIEILNAARKEIYNLLANE